MGTRYSRMEPTEQTLRESLSSVRESLLELKYALKNIDESSERFERNLEIIEKDCDRSSTAVLSLNQRLSNVEDGMKNMNTDIRSVRNSVLGSLIVALLISVSGLAFSTVVGNTQNNSITKAK